MVANGRRAIELAAWITLATALGLALADIWTGFWDHDAGNVLLHAAYIAEGLKPYLDYTWIYPTLIDILTAIPIALGADRTALTFSTAIFWIALNTAATYLLALVMTRDRFTAIVAASMFPLFSIQNGGNHLTLEHGVILFSILAIASAMTKRWLLAGVFVSAAILSKQNGVIVVLVLAAIPFTRRDLMRFIAGAIPLPLAWIAWLHFRIDAIYLNIVSNVGQYAQTVRVPGWEKEFARAPQTATLFMVCAVAAVALIRAATLRWVVLAAVAAAVIQFLPRILRNYPHYNLNMWPFLVVILAAAATRWPRLVRPVFAIVATATLFAFVNRAQAPSALVTTLIPAARIVESSTPPGASVRQYGAEPVIEYLAHRRQEVIDKGATTFNWKGGDYYATPPQKGTTVVVVDQWDDGWVAPVMRKIEAAGFQKTASVGRFPPRVSIYR